MTPSSNSNSNNDVSAAASASGTTGGTVSSHAPVKRDEALDQSTLRATPSPYKGRPCADVWEFFTATANPQRLLACVCRHCGVEVPHRKKSERAKAHLAKRCPPFRTLMLAIEDPALRPEWFNELCERRRVKSEGSASAPVTKRARQSLPTTSLPHATTAPTGAVSATATTALPVGGSTATHPLLPTMRDKQLQLLAATAPNHKQPRMSFDAATIDLAMHFYVTGTPFAHAEDPFLHRAIHALAPNAALPTRQQLSNELLDVCYSRVQAAVARAATRNSSSPNSTSSIDLHTGARAVAQACAQVVEQLFTPTVTVGTTTMSPLEHLAVFVSDCSALVDELLRDVTLRVELEHEQRALGLAPLVPLLPTRLGHDLKRWLDAVKSLEDALYELVTGHDFARSRVPERARLGALVTAGSFFEDLDKSLQVLAPIDAAVALAHAAQVATGITTGIGLNTGTSTGTSMNTGTNTKATPPISNAYYSLCVAAPEAFDTMRILSSAECAHVIAAVTRARLDVASASDAGVAYLLDPRYLGTGMASDERYSAEDHLFDYFYRTSSVAPADIEQQKESLFQEYTAFVIKSRSMRQVGGFRYQMLVKGTKTIEQFWLTDGHQFPLLQHVALAVFAPVAPVAREPVIAPVNATRVTSSNATAAVATPFRSVAANDVALERQFTTPMKATSAAGSGSSSSPSGRRNNAPPVPRAQLEKLAFIQANAALLLRDVSDSNV